MDGLSEPVHLLKNFQNLFRCIRFQFTIYYIKSPSIYPKDLSFQQTEYWTENLTDFQTDFYADFQPKYVKNAIKFGQKLAKIYKFYQILTNNGLMWPKKFEIAPKQWKG